MSLFLTFAVLRTLKRPFYSIFFRLAFVDAFFLAFIARVRSCITSRFIREKVIDAWMITHAGKYEAAVSDVGLGRVERRELPRASD